MQNQTDRIDSREQTAPRRGERQQDGSWRLMPIARLFAAAAVSLLIVAGCDSGPAPAPNQAPNPSFTATKHDDDALTYTFDASGSIDTNTGGDVTAYKWEFGDGATATGKVVTHTYAERDRYDVTLTVTDGQGLDNSGTRSIVTGKPPEVKFTATVDEKYSNRYTFDASGTGGEISTYAWEFGDDATASGKVVTHSFDIRTDQEFEVTLTVKGKLGAELTETKTVSVDALEFIPIPRTNWQVIDVDSNAIQMDFRTDQEGDVHPRFVPFHAIDGDVATFWNTEYRPDRPAEPHFITVDMGEIRRMYSFKIVGRDEFRGQNPKNVTIKFSDDGMTWSAGQSFTTPLTFTREPPPEQPPPIVKGKVYLSEPVEARYFKFIVTNNVNPNNEVTQLNELKAITSEADLGM